MARVALSSGAYTARSVIAAAQRSVNLYGEPLPTGNKYTGSAGLDEPSSMAHYPTPGLRLLGTLPQGNVRGIKQATTGGIYAVAGDGVYLVDPNTWTGTLLGHITGLRPYPVSMQDNGNTLVIVDGTTSGWTVDLASHAFAQIPPTIPRSQAAGATMVANGIDYRVGDHVNAVGGTLLSGQAPVLFTVTSIDSGGGITGLTLAAPGSYTKKPDDPTPLETGGAGSRATVHLLYNELSEDNAFYGADKVDYLDTYLLFNKPGTPQFYSSDSLATTFDPNWWANKESFSDLLVTLAVAKREIWLFGERTTEVWYNAGAPDYPFAEIQSAFIDHGIRAKYSVATYNNQVFWLSYDRAGQGHVRFGEGYESKRISTFAIEQAFTTYPRIDDAIGFVYSLGGHVFYVLTFPHADVTWVYDITTSLWHEWLWIDVNGTEHRHRANCCYAINGMVVVGDWQNGNLYAVETSAGTDNGQPIKRVRGYPHMLNDGKRVAHRQFIADLEAGTGGNQLPEPPQVSLRWSDDRGHTYGSPVLIDGGATGEYLRSLQWQRLGMARDRVYEIWWSTPYPTALQGAWIDVTPASS